MSNAYLSNLFGLEGKTAINIGGTGTLGQEFSKALAGAGAKVYVVGQTLKKDDDGKTVIDRITEAGGSARFFKTDCTKRSDLDAIVNSLIGTEKEADILVNGAGINSATPFLEIDEDEWENILNINLRSVRLACQVFGKFMIEKKTKGSIINIASLSGITALSRVFTYSATKAAVINLTQNLAREWAPEGIRVNALSPGFFPAKQNLKILTKERIASIKRHTPMLREGHDMEDSPFGYPEELAGAILLMASNTAGSFLTGANIVVDGGFSAMTI